MQIEVFQVPPFDEPVDDTTVVIPFMRGGNEKWLEEAKSGFAHGQKLVVVENDGEMAESAKVAGGEALF